MRQTYVYASETAPPDRLDAPLYTGYQMMHPDMPMFAMRAAKAAESRPLADNAAGASDLPKAFGIEQNYPNPFNPSTTIRFALPRASHVRLNVFNVAGERVATLIDSEAPAGYHTVKLDARGLASGVYFYKIEAGNFTETKKMVLLR